MFLNNIREFLCNPCRYIHDEFSIQVTKVSKQGATSQHYVLTEEAYDTPPTTYDVDLQELLIQVAYSF